MIKKKPHKNLSLRPSRVSVRSSRVLGFIIALAILIFLTASVFVLSSRFQNSTTTQNASAAADDFLSVNGRALSYRGQTVYLRGSNLNNIGALCSRVGLAGSWGSCNIGDINIVEADYAKLAEMGGNHFRFGMSYSWYRNSRESFFQVLDQHVAWARKHNVWIVWNLFTLPGDCYEGFVIQSCPFWNDSTMKGDFKRMWVDMASRYKNEPAVAGYDLLNEPLPPGGNSSIWFDMAQDVTNAIRDTGSNQLVFITTLADPTFTRTFSGGNIVYEAHDYTPMGLSHANSGTSANYPGTLTEWCGAHFWDLNSMKGNNSCTGFMVRYPGNWASQNNVPLYIGEWGSRPMYSGYLQYIRDKGTLYVGNNIHHAHYVWRHSRENWGLFNPDRNAPLIGYSPELVSAVQNSFSNAVRPNFGGGPVITGTFPTSASTPTPTRVVTSTPTPTRPPNVTSTLTPMPTQPPTGGQGNITIQAGGSQGAGVYPVMGLYVSDVLVQRFTIRSSALETYSAQVNSLPNINQVKITFENDYNGGPGNDRNLQVASVRVGNVTYLTTDPTTYSKGTWTPVGGCNEGSKRSQWLHCDGYFTFGGGGTAQPTPTRPVNVTVAPTVPSGNTGTYPRILAGTNSELEVREVKPRVGNRVFIEVVPKSTRNITTVEWWVNGRWTTRSDRAPFLMGNGNGLDITSGTKIRVVAYYDNTWHYIESTITYIY